MLARRHESRGQSQGVTSLEFWDFCSFFCVVLWGSGVLGFGGVLRVLGVSGVRRPWRRVGWEKEVKTSFFVKTSLFGGYPGSFSMEDQTTHRINPHKHFRTPPPHLPPLPIDGAALATFHRLRHINFFGIL